MEVELCPEGIVLALASLGKAGKSAALTQRIKAVGSSGQQLMYVALVPDVPDDMILGRIKHAVQGDGQLDYAQIGRQVSAVFIDTLDRKITDLSVQAKQLPIVQSLELLGAVYVAEILIFGKALHTAPPSV